MTQRTYFSKIMIFLGNVVRLCRLLYSPTLILYILNDSILAYICIIFAYIHIFFLSFLQRWGSIEICRTKTCGISQSQRNQYTIYSQLHRSESIKERSSKESKCELAQFTKKISWWCICLYTKPTVLISLLKNRVYWK